jgi:hypothetical protein
MRYVIATMLILVGIIHLLPLSGVFGSERLASLYGLSFQEPNLAILMRHRAVLFGLLGLFLLYASFRPALQTMAFTAGFISVVSFLWIAASVADYNSQVAKVFAVDVVALGCLIVGGVAHIYQHLRS